MQRVYLLLRNNRQTGPFTIDELLQQQLRASDMLWIEGKSTAWSYIAELELFPSVTETKAAEHTGDEGDEIEKKAEEIRKRALASARTGFYGYHPAQTAHDHARHQNPYLQEEEAIDFVDHRKEKRNIVSELVMTCFIIVLFAGGLYKGNSLFREKKGLENSVVTKIVSGDTHTAVQKKEAAGEHQVVTGIAALQDTASLIPEERPKPRTETVKKSAQQKMKHIPAINLANLNTAAKTEEEIIVPPVQDEAVPEKQVALPQANEKTAEPEKKKGFLKGLFRKKKKTEDQLAGTEESSNSQ
jgi:hypothetical protein